LYNKAASCTKYLFMFVNNVGYILEIPKDLWQRVGRCSGKHVEIS